MTEQGSNPQTPRAPLTLCPLWGKMAAGDAAGFVVEGGRRGGGERGAGRYLAAPWRHQGGSSLNPPFLHPPHNTRFFNPIAPNVSANVSHPRTMAPPGGLISNPL